jgi:branched-chain amino acid transport system ATP-binding protein
MLRLEAVDVFIQSSHILRGVSLAVEPGSIACLVGRNGAGKTTVLRTVMGFLRPAAGRILLAGEAIGRLPTHVIARRGVGYAPEEGGIFADLTVAENVEIATWTRPAGPPAARTALAYEVFPRLRHYAARGGAHLSGGERKMLAIARALALDPRVLLLDEPFEGLSPAVVPHLVAGITAIARQGRAILLAESNVHHLPPGTGRLYVLERGEIVYGGPPEGARTDPAALRARGGGR